MPRRTDDLTTFLDLDAMRRFHRAVYAPHHWPDGAVVAVPTILKGTGVRTNRVPVADVEAFVELCTRGVERGADVYVNVAPQRPGLDISARGGRKDALSLPALFVDVDVADGVHKAASGAAGGLSLPSRAEAVELVRSLPLPITALVSTGGGLHVWSCLTEPLDHESDTGVEVLRRWKMVVKRLFNDAGFHIDEGVLADPARMLRAPGTTNHKAAPRPVRLLCDDQTSPDEWEAAVAGWVAESATAEAA